MLRLPSAESPQNLPKHHTRFNADSADLPHENSMIIMMIITIIIITIMTSYDSPGIPCESQDMHSGAGPVNNIDQATVVELDIVGLDRAMVFALGAGMK